MMEFPACAIGPLAPEHDWREHSQGGSDVCRACGVMRPHAKPSGRKRIIRLPGPRKIRITWDPPIVQQLLDRDGDRCTFCHRRFSLDLPPTKDHRIPQRLLHSMRRAGLAAPGNNDLDNLQLACRPCNNLRGDMDEALFRAGIEDGTITLPWSQRRPGISNP